MVARRPMVQNAVFAHVEFDCPCCGNPAFLVYRATGNLAGVSQVVHRKPPGNQSESETKDA